MGQINGDPLDELFSSVGLPGASQPSLPITKDSNNGISPSRVSTYSISSPPTYTSNPLDRILSPLVPFSTSKHPGSNPVSTNICPPSTSASPLSISTLESSSNTAHDQPLSNAAWANLWARLALVPSPKSSSTSRVKDLYLCQQGTSTCSRVPLLGNEDMSPQTSHHPASTSSTQTSATLIQPPSSRLLTKVNMFLTTTVHPGLRAHPNTLFPSAYQSIGLNTRTITQMAQTVTQTITETVTSTATVTAGPIATDAIMADAPGIVNATANSSVINTTAANLVKSMLGHASVDSFPLHTTATKVVNATAPVLFLSNRTVLTCWISGMLLGAGMLQTAQYLRQRRRRTPSAPVGAEERTARRWGFLWRKEVEKGNGLRPVTAEQAAHALERDIQDELNAEITQDAIGEATPPQNLDALTQERYSRETTSESILSQDTDAFSPITRRYALGGLPAANDAPPTPSFQATSPPTTRRMLFPAKETNGNMSANTAKPIHQTHASTDDFLRNRTHSSGARGDKATIEDRLKKSLAKAKAWQDSKPSIITGSRRKRSSDDAGNDSFESSSANIHPDTPVPTTETSEPGNTDHAKASLTHDNPILDLETKPTLRFSKRIRASSEISDLVPASPVARTTRSKSPRKARGYSFAPEPSTVRRSSRIKSMSPQK